MTDHEWLLFHFFLSGDLDLDCKWHFLFRLLLDFSGDLLLESFFFLMLSSMALFVFFANRRMTCTLAIVFLFFLNLQNVIYCHFCGFFWWWRWWRFWWIFCRRLWRWFWRRFMTIPSFAMGFPLYRNRPTATPVFSSPLSWWRVTSSSTFSSFLTLTIFLLVTHDVV